MRFLDLIERKKQGRSLTVDEIRFAVREYVEARIPDYQMAAFLMAVRWRGLDDDEAVALTTAMVESGDRYDLEDLGPSRVDKHSTGGVGDKVSLPLAPLAAEAGCLVPMISGRGLAHTGGTLDKLEAIPGFRTALTDTEFRRGLARIGVAMGAQTTDFVPADRLLYALRDATATVDDPGLITASILSKKIAEGTRALVLDVKTGAGAFCRDLEQARFLARRLLVVGNGAGLRCSALLTDMAAPLGMTVGNAPEVREAIACLHGSGPPDLRELVLRLGAEMLVAAGLETDRGEAGRCLAGLLDDGSAARRFERLIEAQGGDPGVVGNPDRLPVAVSSVEVRAAAGGYVDGIDPMALGLAAVALRAGRDTKEDVVDPAAGMTLDVGIGDAVAAGDRWVTLHHGPAADVDHALELVQAALSVAESAPPARPLILETHT